MNIKPLDVLHMLDDEDLAEMEPQDLERICIALTLDLQLEKEKMGNIPLDVIN